VGGKSFGIRLHALLKGQDPWHDTEGKVYMGRVLSICYQVDMVPSDTEGKVYMGRVLSICYQVGGFAGITIL